MRTFNIKVVERGNANPSQDDLAFHLARIAADNTPIDKDVAELVIDRLIDTAAVSVAALQKAPVMSAIAQAKAHPRPDGACIMGLPNTVRAHCEWAAAANTTAVRELDFHDNVFDVEIGHPGDMIPALVAVGQQARLSGRDLLRAIATSYEIHVSLCKSIELQPHGIDHVGHLAPALAGGIGAALRLSVPVIQQAVQQAVQTGYSPGQTRKGYISTWKSYAPAHVAMTAINAVDRAMRGQDSPAPIFEGEHGLFVAMLAGEGMQRKVTLVEEGEPKRQALETFTKEHSAGYHGQVPIDLALRLREQISSLKEVESIVYHTRRRAHMAMGSGSMDPSKYDPMASRETLDHSLMYLVAVALQDGSLDHVKSYLPERARRPDTVELWSSISSAESAEWNERFDSHTGLQRDLGGRAVVRLRSGKILTLELAVPNAHPRGAAPMDRNRYVTKFRKLAEGIISKKEQDRFLSSVTRLPDLEVGMLSELNIRASRSLHAEHAPGIY